MPEIRVFDASLAAAERTVLAALRREAAAGGPAWFPVWLASLPRRAGTRALDGGIVTFGGVAVDLGSFRACDAAAAVLLTEGDVDIDLPALFRNGDAEERRMILKSLGFTHDRAVQERLLLEAHRQNDQTIFEAGMLDSNVAATVLETGAFNSAVMKTAFLDLPVARILGWTLRANPALSRMLLDFQVERSAAGRAVWLDTLAVAAWAPVSGLEEQIERDLCHENEDRRAAAGIAREVIDRSRRDG